MMSEFLRITLSMIELELRRVRHDQTEMLIRAAQPALWLVIFGSVVGSLRAIPTGGIPYVDFITPGILIQSTTGVAIFYGIIIIWERESGILKKLMVTPAPRYEIVIGRSLAAGLRASLQLFVVLGLALLLGVHLVPSLPNFFLAAFLILFSAAGFASFSMLIATFFKTRERFLGIGQLIIFPLFFASSALYPVSIMPPVLQLFARVNPLTYLVDAARGLLITGNLSNLGADVAITVGFTLAMFALASMNFKRIVE